MTGCSLLCSENNECTAFTVQSKYVCQMGKIDSLILGPVGTPKDELLSVYIKVNKTGNATTLFLTKVCSTFKQKLHNGCDHQLNFQKVILCLYKTRLPKMITKCHLFIFTKLISTGLPKSVFQVYLIYNIKRFFF